MTIFTQEAPILVTCPKDMPEYLKAELEGLGFARTHALDAGVETYGTLNDCMRLNLWVRTGHRVLFELKRFRAFDADELYREIKALPWEEFIARDGYFRVDASIRDTTVNDSRFAGLRVKDAVADRFMDKYNERPDSGPETNGVCLFLHWRENQATIYLDTTGDPLPRRGYRKRPHTAPMQETLAAACILASGWPELAKTGSHFIAPMCGAGTLAIEAALMAMNGAPGLLRDNFAFMQVLGFDPETWDGMLAEAEDAENPEIKGRIIATDHDPEAVDAARDNARLAGVGDFIEFEVCDFSETDIPDGPGLIMLNPEYGQRLGDLDKLEEVYKSIGDFFKQRCGGKTGFIFTGNSDLAKRVGLRTKSRRIFWNAKIECRLLEYELYEGTKKQRS
ncbi:MULTISPECIES: THUMP domain-containing protein [unclassified Pseudodesulfovibrio]|uniref:THUMP domain-containing class I SAM-dependent RNA methyltransferase n=1 Tax=unclassified Pseudodesulfovibrio TaxID=2661612 RepID=UPI000FEBF0C5|nr:MULTISPECIES: THUMP domain-containing protein [unclassified Pseudodesulfovibrio]MCJ2165531.1 THUMP domain-containing protein [Pseudodesulfovibrio sp. S3-i]RWU03108.1 class I SAM-dependent RNA methyltransferase [Pseudodesulfovibrio sp. S3]